VPRDAQGGAAGRRRRRPRAVRDAGRDLLPLRHRKSDARRGGRDRALRGAARRWRAACRPDAAQGVADEPGRGGRVGGGSAGHARPHTERQAAQVGRRGAAHAAAHPRGQRRRREAARREADRGARRGHAGRELVLAARRRPRAQALRAAGRPGRHLVSAQERHAEGGCLQRPRAAAVLAVHVASRRRALPDAAAAHARVGAVHARRQGEDARAL